jgi:hypothetical protein
MRRLLISVFLLSGLLLIPFTPDDCLAQQQPDAKLAMLAALDFLELCDRGDFVAAWGQTAELFRENTEQESWQLDINHLRRQYGEIQKRQLLYSKQLQEPEQPMQLLLFRSNFAIKAAAELLTMVKEKDQRWRVVGYSIE